MVTLKELEAKVRSAARAFGEAKRALKAAQLAACPVKVGDIVVSRGVEYRVLGIDTSWDVNRPWLVGVPRKKNGEFGARTRNLYGNWNWVKK